MGVGEILLSYWKKLLCGCWGDTVEELLEEAIMLVLGSYLLLQLGHRLLRLKR